jgi:fermentation-respiration switch protein FrsA (DUF1100 family)
MPLRNRIVRSATKLLAALAGLYLVLLVAGCLGYRSIVYMARRDEGPRPRRGAVVRALRATDGAPVQVLHFPAPPGAPTLVQFHGNAETLRTEAPFGAELHALGLGVMLVEYRGYGAVPGTPGEEAIYLDAEAVLDALAAEGVTPDRIVLSGFSLGTGVAVEMAARGRGGRLILMAPYTSVPRVAAHYAPFLPTSIVVQERFDTLAKAGRVLVPTLVLHGDADPIIPYEMGRTVAGAIAGAELITVPGGHHNDLFSRQPGLMERIASFAKRAKNGSAPP